MEGARFDSLARLVAASMPRRTLFKTLAGGLMGAVAGAPRPGSALPASAPPNRAGRGGFCDYDSCTEVANLNYDICRRDNCGELTDEPIGKFPCLLSCLGARRIALKGCQERGGCDAGLHCVGGICCEANQVNCGDGVCCTADCCGGRCVDATCRGDLTFNRTTCRCECPPGTYACPSGGGTTCFRVTCTGGKVPDPDTCQCTCPSCSGGKVADPTTCECRCPDLTCPQGQTQDPRTCQCRCAETCPQDQTQDPATCACTCGGASCAGTCCDGTCVDLRTDRTNCGRCGNACTGGRTCQNGQCLCPPDRPDQCNGVCTNFTYDRFACGGCGSVFVCPGGPFTACCPGKGIGTGLCTNPDIDGENCGRCGNACTGGKKCESGRCVCPSGTRDCHGQCKATCEPEGRATCPVGGVCNNTPPCSPEVPGCLCGITTEGTGVCVPNPDCDEVPPCLSSANCPPGEACVKDNCCDDGLPRCAPICSTQGPSATAVSRALGRSSSGRLTRDSGGVRLIPSAPGLG